MNISQLDLDVDFLCGSTSATYPTIDKRRNQNIAYQDVATLIWESDGGWHYDDSNNSDSPVAYKTLANASASYLIPTTAIRIEGVEIKKSDTHWDKLTPITYADLTQSPEEFYATPGLPRYYQLEGNEIRLYPSPNSADVTLASGMAVRLSRAVTELPVSGTTGVPGFASAFHRILSLASSIDFVQDEQQRKFLLGERARLQNGLTRFYSKRAEEFKTTIKPAGKKRWRQYL